MDVRVMQGSEMLLPTSDEKGDDGRWAREWSKYGGADILVPLMSTTTFAIFGATVQNTKHWAKAEQAAAELDAGFITR